MLLDEKVNANFDKLNDNDLQIAHFVNTHVNQCKTLKIHELSQYTHASNATIHRFTRKLGFDGYSDFKSYLKFESEHLSQLPKDSMDAFKQEIETTLSYLDRIDYNLITDKLNQASTVYLYGTGRAQKNVADEAQRILLTMHKNIIVLHDVHELKMVLNRSIDEDLFFIISLSGESHQLTDVTNLLQLRQKYFISVTTMKDNSLAQKRAITFMYQVILSIYTMVQTIQVLLVIISFLKLYSENIMNVKITVNSVNLYRN